MSVEYGVRYRPRGSEERTERVSDGTVERAEFAAHGMLVIGCARIQIVKRARGGDWVTHRKVSHVRELGRALTSIRPQVYWGPNRGSAEWLAKGEWAWGCDACLGESGGYEDTEAWARRMAMSHAKTHRTARAVYYEG